MSKDFLLYFLYVKFFQCLVENHKYLVFKIFIKYSLPNSSLIYIITISTTPEHTALEF